MCVCESVCERLRVCIYIYSELFYSSKKPEILYSAVFNNNHNNDNIFFKQQI